MWSTRCSILRLLFTSSPRKVLHLEHGCLGSLELWPMSSISAAKVLKKVPGFLETFLWQRALFASFAQIVPSFKEPKELN